MTNELFVKMVLDTWYSKVKAADMLFDELSDEQLMNEVSPGRNRGIYLLGHLAVVHDMMLPLLDLGPQQYPHLTDPFENKPDKAVAELPPIAELRQSWKAANKVLAAHFSKMQAGDWFKRHMSVSEEDFAKEPHRNKLNVIINRTNHLSYHTGQLVLLKK